MADQERDEEFAAVAARERPLLESFALLMTGDARQAEAAVGDVLARLYERRGPLGRFRIEALRGLVVHDPRTGGRSDARAADFELVEGALGARNEHVIVSDLGRLRPDQRAVILLERQLACPSVHIAEIVGRPVDEVLVLARQAQAALAVGHPERKDDASLAAELRDALAPAPSEITPCRAADDVARGRALVRRRAVRRALLGIAAAVVLVLLLTEVFPRLRPTPEAAPPELSAPFSPTPSPTPSASGPSCDKTSATCRGEILRQWRATMVEVSGRYLDPTGVYFTDFGYAPGSHYETSAFWSGRDNALALELYRRDGAGTTVLLQIASSRREAPRCGDATGNPCVSQRFLDGNRYTLSQSTNVAEGIEVQYSPLGDEVITVIARNTGSGRPLELTRGDLIALVQDERLRLPER